MLRRRPLGNRTITKDVARQRALMNLTSFVGGGGDHGLLNGLIDDDHSQYLLVDGSRNLAGNLAVDGTYTIDGVDISVSVPPATLSVTSTNQYATAHTHAITASAAPGLASALLKTDSGGNLQIAAHFTANTSLSGGKLGLAVNWDNNEVYINCTNPPTRRGALVVHPENVNQRGLVLELLSGQVADLFTAYDNLGNPFVVLTNDGDLESGNPGFSKGISGWQLTPEGDAEFNNVRVRGSIRASVFEYGDIQATAGTLIVAKSAAKLHGNWTSPGQTWPTVGSNFTDLEADDDVSGTALFSVGDVLRIKTITSTGVIQVWAYVTVVTPVADYTRYSGYLMSGDISEVFPKGTGIADYGNHGDGAIYLSADGVVGASANISMSDFTYGIVELATKTSGGTLYTALDVLNLLDAVGSLGCTIRVDTVDGGGVILTYTLLTGGSRYAPAYDNAVTGGTGSGATFTPSQLSGPWSSETLKTRLGNMNGSYGTGSNDRYGIGIGDYSSGNYLSYNAQTADQFILTGGAGNLTIDEKGITIQVYTADAYNEPNALTWKYGSAESFRVYCWENPSAKGSYLRFEDTVDGKSRVINIFADAPGQSDLGQVWLRASEHASGTPSTAEITLYADGSEPAYIQLATDGYTEVLTDNFTLNETGNAFFKGYLTVGDGSGAKAITLDGAAGAVRDVRFASAGSLRWVIRTDGTAEGGSNVGSDLSILARSDAGAVLFTPIKITRSTGNIKLGSSTDLYTVPWTDYSGDSTIIGWASRTETNIWYKKTGKTVWVQFRISGTSNANNCTFTVPFSRHASGSYPGTLIWCADAGTLKIGYFTVSGTTVSFRPTIASGLTGWSTTGTKTIHGRFSYEAA